MKKVVVISTSLRHGSNSDMLADQFAKGAKAAGNEVEIISLVDKSIQFCKGCLACQKLGRCVINDDANEIMAKVLNADDDENTPKRAETGLTGWIDCYPKSRIAGTLFCGGVNSPHEIEGNPKLQEAFELGKSV